ncbi:hypothetical protein IWT140_00163 [Secundilactobacillus pentosiphilus]|uniref:Uncharacterized protein n=1 Tax=Secundilactobacillus pentosiphilus TaxID=1714682 RepID=A0A1Z5ILJ9_9LACO|nr:hypothetical protein IWT140_00163 [Secundilactobacillus pentosiphilus]
MTSVICIILVYSFQYITESGTFIELSGWGSAFLSGVSILIVFFKLNKQDQEKTENERKQKDKELRIEEKKDVSVRPKFSFRYLNWLKMNQHIIYNLNYRAWMDNDFSHGVSYMIGLKPTFRRSGHYPLIFTTEDRFITSKLLGITNISNHDAYNCLIELKYICGPETDKLKKHENYNAKKVDLEVRTEYLTVPLISAKEELVVVPYTWTHKANSYMVSITLKYETERGELLEATFDTNEDPEDILKNKKNIDAIPKVNKLDEEIESKREYQDRLASRERLTCVVDDYVRGKQPDATAKKVLITKP